MQILNDPSVGHIRVDSFPDTCPVCHYAVTAESPYAQPNHMPSRSEGGSSDLQIVFRCPRRACGTLFVAEYVYVMPTRTSEDFYRLGRIFPLIPKAYNVQEGVAEVSPSFVLIANEAAAAEAYGLQNIAGLGYRKAVEFLIKDYCITLVPTRASEIKQAWLGECINMYVSDPKVKLCARRATWLGNDEAHYERVWNDHDIGDLKNLIRLTQIWITSDVLTKRYADDMPGGNAAGKSDQADKK